MYCKEMLSDEILKSIKRIMRSKILSDYEKCIIIKNFINNLIDSDFIIPYEYVKRRLQNE